MDIRMQFRNKKANADLQNKKQNFHLGVEINLQRQGYFEQLLSKVYFDIMAEDFQYKVYPVTTDCEVIFQCWTFEFMGQKNFEGRSIKGVLKFQPDYPKGGPSFYLDPVITDKGAEVLTHPCIYGDHYLCVHLFTFWGQMKCKIDDESRIREIEILQAIEYIFNNPNILEGDSCPNPSFASESPERQQEIQKRQAEFLPFFNKDT
ncbi:unnamed protein product (macronuclear) [Paramecium tetraurelia]|uniref:UBC core domain-containing protein n=1 Tax=Paramecium tetraurelia TaxID=5888 RepID=A0BCZ6_PARTE|nr:uncharacterized protein GSPATT00004507001 [Paramecium tetraurelia]CAK56413.1 unnamed protein product [Paramecium tetraurelia]|eukprot:XP_001423811.1 hypothetical protein (macronuclear) [Paramecium tetraurelia strain d4-2]